MEGILNVVYCGSVRTPMLPFSGGDLEEIPVKWFSFGS